MRLFGRPAAAGSVSIREGAARLSLSVESVPFGFRVGGNISGRAGRIEAFRAPSPRRFLLNNWQSWGPCQAVDRGRSLEGVVERMESYSRWVFTPIPDVFARQVVSDYFVAWEGTVAGFLSSHDRPSLLRGRGGRDRRLPGLFRRGSAWTRPDRALDRPARGAGGGSARAVRRSGRAGEAAFGLRRPIPWAGPAGTSISPA